MKKVYLSILFLFVTNLMIIYSQISSDYELVWQEEFDDSSSRLPCCEKWWFETGGHGWGNNELQYYIDKYYQSDTVALVKNGKLVISAIKLDESYNGKQYISARMNSKESWKYGYFEMRAKVPAGRGVWAAFWMMPANFKEWPLDGEIDIMEYVGYRPDTIQSTVHTAAYNHMYKNDKSGIVKVEDVEQEFSVYAVEWTENKIVGYVNGQPYFSFENDKAENKATWPFNKPFYLKLNLAIGGDWGGLKGVDTSIFPAQYEIDYVRVYQKRKSLTSK